MAEEVGALWVGEVDRLNLLEQNTNVAHLNIGPQGPRFLNPIEQLLDDIKGPRSEGSQLVGGGDDGGEPKRERAGAVVNRLVHEPDECLPGIAFGGERGLRLSDVLAQAINPEPLDHILFVSIAAIEGTDADARVGSHGGDRRAGIGDEHRTRGGKNRLVVARGLGPATA